MTRPTVGSGDEILTRALVTAARAGYGEAETFRMADLAMATSGVFYAGPDAFLIAFPEDNAWHLWLAVSVVGMERFFALAPYPLPFVSWSRETKGRSAVVRFPWERIRRLASGLALIAPPGHFPNHYERRRQEEIPDPGRGLVHSGPHRPAFSAGGGSD